MASLLIRRNTGGESFVIDDSALQFFLSQGYVVVGSIDDEAAESQLHLSAAETDARYLHMGDVGDPASPTGAELRGFLEEKIDRTGATAGQVPILQADGTLLFGAGGNGGGGGGGTGTVTSVNGIAPDVDGDVPLDADDVPDGAGRVLMTSAERTLLTSLSTTALYLVRHNGVTDPVRPNTQRPVAWIVPDADRPALNGNTSGGSYAAVDGLDIMWTY